MTSSSRTTLYYYTPPCHVLDNLRKRRIKISRFSRCNDLFELAAFNLDKGQSYEERHRFRGAIRCWSQRQDSAYGLICFSTTWRSPLMWAHYAGRHTGLCLEFSVDRDRLPPDAAALLHVDYTPKRLAQNGIPRDLGAIRDQKLLRKYCATKFSHWRYENEVRLLIKLRAADVEETEEGLRFLRTGGHTQLTGIFMGVQSWHGLEKIEDAVGTTQIPIVQTRAAFSKFQVVRQQNRKYWKSTKTSGDKSEDGRA